MTKETKIRVLRIYGILLSIVIVIAGICLMAGCLSIYYSGDQPYSREIVAETFSKIAIPIYLCLAMTILGFVLEFFLPAEPLKPKAEKNYVHLLNRLHANRSLTQSSDSLQSEVAALQANRKRHILIRTALIVVASVVFLVYALNGNNYHSSEINGSMIKAMYILIPCLLISFGYALFVSIHNEKSIRKEIELLKQAPMIASACTTDSASNGSESDENKKILIIRCAILAVGVFCLVYGYLTGGIADVLAKAINICTECIGLG